MSDDGQNSVTGDGAIETVIDRGNVATRCPLFVGRRETQTGRPSEFVTAESRTLSVISKMQASTVPES